MLKAHQACIDLEKNVLRIQGREVRFLNEHELPHKAREPPNMELEGLPVGPPASSSLSSSGQPPSSFPGSGRTLRGAPAATTRPSNTGSRHPESAIKTMMDLGTTREQAVNLLDAAEGNVDVAASMLF
ncbi:hypothetical protein AX15_007268 [Amanita polypyramis BW_CC]|nr:hypothetical protein AX15_007268 [Amanita polypyramis BW_CC]